MNKHPTWAMATSPDQPQTIDGYRVGGLQKSVKKGQLFGYLFMPDPAGFGIRGPTTWYYDGQPTDEGDPPLKVDTIPFDL